LNVFFDKTGDELEVFFAPIKEAAHMAGIRVHQMHMPFPCYVPGANQKVNDYLLHFVAPKSMYICKFFECPYIVVHGFKLVRELGSEEAEWGKTEDFLKNLAPVAKKLGITICMENLFSSEAGHLVEGPCCNAEKAAERIDRINEEYGEEVLGFCLDTGHANVTGIDLEDFIVTLGNRLKVLHIHDNDGVRDLHQIPFTAVGGRGNTSSVDWDGFIHGLRKIQFDQVLSFEIDSVFEKLPEEMKTAMLSFIGEIGTYFAEKIQGDTTSERRSGKKE